MSQVIPVAVCLSVLFGASPTTASPPADQAPGRVRCELRDNGASAPGELAVDAGVFTACAEGLRLPAGTHRVRLRLRDTLAGAETVRHVRVEAGRTATLRADFETGELLLWMADGAKAAAASAEVWHDGEVRGRLQSGRATRLGAGTYVVDAKANEARQRFEAVHVQPGGRTVLVWGTER